MRAIARVPARVPVVPAAVAGAWLLAVAAQLTGNAALLHHHSLIEDGPPLWLATPIFLVAWQVMIGAMMLPASLPAIRSFSWAAGGAPRPRRDLAAFLASYAAVWTTIGLLAFMGDVVLHHIVDATPWLAARPWLIEASVVAFAGVYQLTPMKRLTLAACRHPLASVPGSSRGRGAFQLGLDHGITCVGSSGALMLLMFAEGFANLWWMVALTAVMVYEATGRHGQRGAQVIGVGLLVLAGIVVLS